MSKPVKQTLLMGALTSSFGIFVSKALGLIYYSPLSSLAGEANMSFYSIAYTYYDVLLKISGAGIPFAMAALVAKYVAREDYKTALLIKKLGTSIIMAMSFVTGMVFLMFSSNLARQSMGADASLADIHNLQVLFVILVLAVIVVPYLSSLRGYYQGLKRLDIYASSQVLEQFVRIATILAGGYAVVRILHLESIYAIFVAMFAAGLAAIVTIFFVKANGKKDDAHINELIKNQESPSLKKKEIIKEIFMLGIPYIIISFFGSASTLINTTFFLDYAARVGMDYENAKLSLGILQANCNKLMAIPQVLTLGFSSGLVPYLSESLEQNDFEKLTSQIVQILKTVLYFLIPLILGFAFFAKDLYFVMYGNRNLTLGAGLFAYDTLIGFTDTLAPIMSSIMITLRLKKEAILTLILSFVVKYVTFYAFIKNFGAHGMIYSSAICSLVAICVYIYVLKIKFDFKFKTTFISAVKITNSALIVIVPLALLRRILPIAYSSRFINLGLLGVIGVIAVVIYFFVTRAYKLPQDIFEIDDVSIKSLIKKFRK